VVTPISSLVQWVNDFGSNRKATPVKWPCEDGSIVCAVYGDKAGVPEAYYQDYSNSLEVVWLCRSLLKIERAIVDRHLPQNEDPPKPLPKTVHELDARFDDSKSNRSLGFEPN
jgi:hypothetical protein